jgi:hypothetical protein
MTGICKAATGGRGSLWSLAIPMRESIKFDDEVKHLLRSEPFTPFAVVMTSGARYVISDPYHLAFGESVGWIVPIDSPAVFFRKSQVASVEIAKERPHPRRKRRG